jgi:SPP1 gp7 family putative phage head morphogenesis protein
MAETHAFRPLELLSDALNFILQKAIRIVSTVNSDALTAVRDSLLSSLKFGETPREAEGRLSEAVTPFVSAGVVDEAQRIPSRLEVIVRTETTNAYNMGRIIAARSPAADKIIQGFEYSAILDSRTTAVCRKLDGRFIAKGDPDLARLSPPNHFNCRSLLVPVTIIDDPGEPISPSEKGRIFELAGKGFV